MAQQFANVTMKARALDKDEVMLLLNLISKEKIITIKATNATNNKLKEIAWKTIAESFSAHVGVIRRPEQLRLKWENLKKAARKRSAAIRQNNLKTGGGKSFIPPDEVLDRVASLLGTTCSGFTVEFGGDREEVVPVNLVDFEVVVPGLQPLSEPVGHADVVVVGDGSTNSCSGDGVVNPVREVGELNYTPKTFLFNTPNNLRNKRRKLAEDLQRAQIEKESALAAYFRAKAERLELENIKLKYEIEQLSK